MKDLSAKARAAEAWVYSSLSADPDIAIDLQKVRNMIRDCSTEEKLYVHECVMERLIGRRA